MIMIIIHGHDPSALVNIQKTSKIDYSQVLIIQEQLPEACFDPPPSPNLISSSTDPSPAVDARRLEPVEGLRPDPAPTKPELRFLLAVLEKMFLEAWRVPGDFGWPRLILKRFC